MSYQFWIRLIIQVPKAIYSFSLKSENIFDPGDDVILDLIQNFDFKFVFDCDETAL